ncbi:MAG: Hsp70 family protein, partial [Deltaproteobacteria bacterium]|nr:Hsp70 family protein [Deltaproteobacteria bacterium]
MARFSGKAVLMTPAVGIDLGTTSSRVAWLDGDRPRLIPCPGGSFSMPSAVSFRESGEVLTGARALDGAVLDPDSTVLSARRLLGLSFSERPGPAAGPFPSRIVRGPGGLAAFGAGGRRRTPQEAAGAVLAALRRAAERHLGREVREAVITVPALFDSVRRQAVRDAARMAGLEPRLMSGSLAAAVAALLRSGYSGKVAAVSLGGGFLDITVADFDGGVVEVVAAGGDLGLGGDDFDSRVAVWLLKQFLDYSGVDLSRDATAMARLRAAAEKARIELSSASTTTVALPGISADAPGAELRAVLNRQHLQRLTEDFAAKLAAACYAAMKEAALSPREAGRLILCGNMARMPGISEVIERVFRQSHSWGADGDGASALGAAVQAGIVKGRIRDLLLIETLPVSLGLEAGEGAVSGLIPKNTSLPREERRIFSTAGDGQTRMVLKLVQGEGPLAENCRSLGSAEISGITPAPAGVPEIEALFFMGPDGVLSVAARELGSSRDLAVVMSEAGGLPPGTVGQLAEEFGVRRAAELAGEAGLEGKGEGRRAGAAGPSGAAGQTASGASGPAGAGGQAASG